MSEQVVAVEQNVFDAQTSEMEEVKKYFDQNGYVVVQNVFSEQDLQPVQERIEEIIADPSCACEGVAVGRENDTLADKSQADGAENPVRNIAGLVRFDKLFQDLASNPSILKLVRTLVGSKVKVFRDQALMKPPGGQAKPVHQDLSYFRVEPADELVTAWVATEDATIENGCMIYVPRSHKDGLFEITPDPERPTHHVPDTRGIAMAEEVSCPVPAGSVIFHHGYTLHRSGVNNSDRSRRSLQFHYSSSRARSQREELNQTISLEID